MSYAAHHKDFGSFVSHQPARKGQAVAKKAGILRRFFDAFVELRQRDVDRQIARFLAARSGGTLTDGLEREISQRVLTSNWSLNEAPSNVSTPERNYIGGPEQKSITTASKKAPDIGGLLAFAFQSGGTASGVASDRGRRERRLE
jgi:hypothetical protein